LLKKSPDGTTPWAVFSFRSASRAGWSAALGIRPARVDHHGGLIVGGAKDQDQVVSFEPPGEPARWCGRRIE
jgi:hypothetical protein